jgi:hypothetical protein
MKKVTISFLAKHGYLKPNQWRNGTINWSVEGVQIAPISIAVDTTAGYLELDYKCNGTPINYRVHLVAIPSNLGKGFVYFFICPKIGKRCRKLYLADTYFYSR